MSACHPLVQKIFTDSLRPLARIESVISGSRVALSLLNYGILKDIYTSEMCLHLIRENITLKDEIALTVLKPIEAFNDKT